MNFQGRIGNLTPRTSLLLVTCFFLALPAHAHGSVKEVTSPAARSASIDAAEGDDVTVIAVIDDGLTPYHWDFLSSKMPQAIDADPSNDLPLDRPPHEWLEGFPSPGDFTSYSPLGLTLEERDPQASIEALRKQDDAAWTGVKRTGKTSPHYYWIPNTKIIGAIDFVGQGIYQPASTHGTGASSVAVGNLHGSCPTCLLVFLDTNFNYEASNAAIRWAESQPWIDVISNSYGKNLAPGTSDTPRDGIYFGETDFQRRASERGLSIFFAAHNGVDRRFIIPTFPLLSSEAGPDWVITVGAVSPDRRGSYTGHGKPADIASIGLRYPAASGALTVGGSGTFGGTSNATPVIAGMYSQALYEVRKRLEGPSRIQDRGVIAKGVPIPCGSARAMCELRDGRLTAEELRARLFHGAIHTPSGMTVGTAGVGEIPPVGEDEFLNEGHGSYFGLMDGRRAWKRELARIVKPMLGKNAGLKRPPGESEWMIVDSFCRQHLWGYWSGGYYVEDQTRLPGPDVQWPLRTTVETMCPALPPP